VVAILDYDEMHDGTPYIVMELLEGESLEDRLLRGPLGVQEAGDVLRQVGKALDAAHQMGIVHRDIKPGNVFLAQTEHGCLVKVLDFGYAKSIDSAAVSCELSSPGMLAGSPAYVSRDLLIDPSALDHRADLWALTVTIFKCLTGDLPFKGEWLGETCEAIIEGRLRRASKLRTELGPRSDAWFSRAFSFDPADRPASGLALSHSFDEQMWIDAPAAWPGRLTLAGAPPPAPARSRSSLIVALSMAACFAIGATSGLVVAACKQAPQQIDAPSLAAVAAASALAQR
jgi:serine/threonine-protein kinase